MNKIIAMLMCIFCASNNVNAQVLEKIHTFNCQVTLNMENTYGDEIPGADCYYGAEFSSYNNTVTFYVYNADFTQRLYKKVTIPERTGEKINRVIATQRIINDDDKYELFVFTANDSKITTSPVNFNEYARCIIYDEDGNKIQDLGTAYSWFGDPTLHFTQGECRMCLAYYTLNSDNQVVYHTAVYRVNGKNDNPNNVRELTSDSPASYLRWESSEAIDLSGRIIAPGQSGIRIVDGKKYIK